MNKTERAFYAELKRATKGGQRAMARFMERDDPTWIFRLRVDQWERRVWWLMYLQWAWQVYAYGRYGDTRYDPMPEWRKGR